MAFDNEHPGAAALAGWKIPASVTGALADCCLIVPTYRRSREIVELLDVIVENAREDPSDVPGRVYLIDGSPNDAVEAAVREWARDRGLPFQLCYVRTPASLTRQRNIGISLSSGEYVFFLDDDARPYPGYFQATREVFTSDREQRIGAVGALVVNSIARPVTLRWRIRLGLGLVSHGTPMMYQNSGCSVPPALLQPFRGTRDVDLLPGCSFTFRRRVFARHRFSSFFEGYSQGEDMEMSLRVGREWRVVLCGDARVIHQHAPGGRPASFKKGRMEVRNRVFIWRRFSRRAASAGDTMRLWLDFAFIGAIDLLRFLRRPWKPGELFHAAGVGAGAAESLLFPPEHREPAAAARYRIQWGAPREAV